MSGAMGDYPSVERIAQLQQMIAAFAGVERVPHLTGSGRPENDVEHSFGLAITCWYLHPKIAPELDLLEILKFALAHDIVELHAGDTFAFGDDQAYIDSKEARERDALKTIHTDWPDFPEIRIYAEGYMDKVSEESKFVKAVDKLLPLLMIGLDEGEAYWKRHGINEINLKQNKQPIFISESVAPYFDLLFEWLLKNSGLPKS